MGKLILFSRNILLNKTVVFLLFTLPLCGFSQQVVDEFFNQTIANPEYPIKKGPLVYIDEGHNNYHTRDGQYKPFSTVLENDGYRVLKYPWRILQIKLAAAKILVIANAINVQNATNWELPTPSAFEKKKSMI
jgi:hypothetical protein